MTPFTQEPPMSPFIPSAGHSTHRSIRRAAYSAPIRAGLLCLSLSACGDAPPPADSLGVASSAPAQTLARPALAPMPALSPALNPVAAGTHRIEPGQSQPIRIDSSAPARPPQNPADEPDRAARPIDAAALTAPVQGSGSPPTIVVMPGVSGAPEHATGAWLRPR